MKSIVLALTALAAAPLFGSISYTCDASITSSQCNFLNTTIAGIYNATFSNATANIYIQRGVTGLGQSVQYFNFTPYSTYRSDLIAASSGDAFDTGAIASLPVSEPGLYGGDDVEVTAALGSALGLTGLTGILPNTTSCGLGTAGCYDAVITITTDANLSSETGGTQGLWYRTGGAQPANDYDFYSIVEHETDEVLGTSSCIGTAPGPALADGCGGSSPSAVDLFRYAGAGSPVLISTTPGAYFSYNGGVSNGAGGAIYNTLANSEDYADYASNCQFVQDATGCLGGSFDITNDGGGETNILDAVGYNRASSAVPEPATCGLLGASLVFLAAARSRRRG